MTTESTLATPTAPPAPLPADRARSLLASLYQVVRLEWSESLRARWFLLYSGIFGGIVALLFTFGLTESRILGFQGLSRLLVTYIQLCMAILPIFVLITTVRSVAGDREAGVFEYLLSLPVPLGAWFWGRIAGRFVLVFLPVFGAMAGAALWAEIRGGSVPWGIFGLYTALLASLGACFLGIGMWISSVARSLDVAQGAAFGLWLVAVLFLDLILLGLMVQEQASPTLVVALAIANPLQSFRIAAMLLFDPNLVLLGPSAFVILDVFGRAGFLAWAVLYPALLGASAASLGFWTFRSRDLP
ncbi:MAG: ABC transporter permease [Myxococcota bacterium]